MNDESPSQEFDDLVEAAVVQLLLTLPETWSIRDPDTFSHAETRAHFLLVAAGLVERRMRIRLRFWNHPDAAEATVTAYGEGGMAIAFEPLLAALWLRWQQPFEEWKRGHAAAVPPVHCEPLGGDEWRLTDQGVLARADLRAKNPRRAMDFIFRRWPLTYRPPVGGDGRLVKMTWLDGPTAPAPVDVKNWEEGARIFSQLLSAYTEKPPEAPKAPEAAKEKAGKYASEADPVPPEFAHGPLQGNQTEMAWAVDPVPGREPRDRQLESRHGNRVWVQRVSTKMVRVFFRSFKALQMANSHLGQIRENPAVWRR